MQFHNDLVLPWPSLSAIRAPLINDMNYRNESKFLIEEFIIQQRLSLATYTDTDTLIMIMMMTPGIDNMFLRSCHRVASRRSMTQ